MSATEKSVRLASYAGARLSLGTAAARNLATTTKTVPQMAGITPRWLLRMLPWVEASGGTYRVNRRLAYRVDDGRVSFDVAGGRVRVIPAELRELPLLRGYRDDAGLAALADRFAPRDFAAGETIVAAGDRSDRVFLIARGRADELGLSEHGAPVVRGVLGPGDHFGDQTLLDRESRWGSTVRAATPGTLLTLSQADFDELRGRIESLRLHLERAEPPPPRNKQGEAAIALAAGHSGEPDLPATFVDYEPAPLELQLSVAQTVLRVHTRVADLYNDTPPARLRHRPAAPHNPMDQLGQQLRLTVAALRERQEYELLNNPEFGLLHNADLRQRRYPRTGPPTPDDLDNLLARRRRTHLFLAHPRTIAAFGRECTRRGIYPATVRVQGCPALAWRGVPVLPCDKIPVTSANTSTILAMRTGEPNQGVIGLQQTGLPGEYQPGVSVRCSGVDGKGIATYLVSAYHSVAVLVPDALGVLEQVEIGRQES